MVERRIAYFGGFACSAVHSMAEPTDSQPLPLQAFWPLQALLADLQALCPLQALTPLQSLVAWPEPLGLWMVWALAANVPAANKAAAPAMINFFCINALPGYKIAVFAPSGSKSMYRPRMHSSDKCISAAISLVV